MPPNAELVDISVVPNARRMGKSCPILESYGKANKIEAHLPRSQKKAYHAGDSCDPCEYAFGGPVTNVIKPSRTWKQNALSAVTQSATAVYETPPLKESHRKTRRHS